ncbi:sprT-like domain-containing Spartan [Brachionus plicatilis]|uniref:SprT-like domain-containing Spartan n=1 Tax=Brachionus plicatilis TaxID=10195 RepID=A0A3M7P3R5_BRAPC|nr:sprT-like domain-containing Spartan [Brachionus plicatilis]
MPKIFTIHDLDLFDDEDPDEHALPFPSPVQSGSGSGTKKPNLSIDAPLSSNLNDPTWELIDPCPDIRAMFLEFDKLYFWNRLGSCIVEWSKRMTICAGIFYLREGGIIRLSEPLLKYRPRADLVQTLLHEMIHAYLYLTRNFKDRGEHGDEFKSHMNRINKLANTNITIYHSFHDEVRHARQHVWRCNGPCQKMAPFYGFVKRSMNRAPGKNDTWWASHAAKCNGTFDKVSEPEDFSKKANKKERMDEKKIDKSVKFESEKGEKSFVAKKRKHEADTGSVKKIDSFFKKRDSDIIVLDDDVKIGKEEVITLDNFVQCPICFNKFAPNLIDSHVNQHF